MKYLVAIPCMDMMHTQFVCSLVGMTLTGDTEYYFVQNSLIYDARNQVAKKVIESGIDRVLWFDSDMTFARDIAIRLDARLNEGYEYVSGLYMTRKKPYEPCLKKTIDTLHATAELYLDYPRGQIFPVAATGFGGCMMTGDLIRRVAEKYGLPFSPILGFGEDISFCVKAASIGAKIYCDSSIRLGHIGFTEIGEGTYLETVRDE